MTLRTHPCICLHPFAQRPTCCLGAASAPALTGESRRRARRRWRRTCSGASASTTVRCDGGVPAPMPLQCCWLLVLTAAHGCATLHVCCVWRSAQHAAWRPAALWLLSALQTTCTAVHAAPPLALLTSTLFVGAAGVRETAEDRARDRRRYDFAGAPLHCWAAGALWPLACAGGRLHSPVFRWLDLGG